MKIFYLSLLLSTFGFSETKFTEGACKLVSTGGTISDRYYDLGSNEEVFKPYTYKINEDDRPYNYCSASLIDENHILTAAHCFQGNIEQTVSIDKRPIRVRKKIINEDGKEEFVVPKRCTRPDWTRDKTCIANVIKRISKTNLGNVSAHCFTKDGKFKEIKLEKHNGWPNSMFSAKFTKTRFDLALWKTKEKVKDIKPIQIVLDQKKAVSIVEKNGLQCVTLGFGPKIERIRRKTKEGKIIEEKKIISRDQYKHINVHIDFINEIKIISNIEYSKFGSWDTQINSIPLDQNGQKVDRDFSRTEQGDSGGPLLCPDDKTGELVQIGLVSGDTSLKNAPFRDSFQSDRYTSVPYNKFWINHIKQTPKLEKRSKNQFHEVAIDYEINFALKEYELAKKCYDTNKENLNDSRAGFSKEIYKGLLKNYKKKLNKVIREKNRPKTISRNQKYKIKIREQIINGPLQERKRSSRKHSSKKRNHYFRSKKRDIRNYLKEKNTPRDIAYIRTLIRKGLYNDSIALRDMCVGMSFKVK